MPGEIVGEVFSGIFRFIVKLFIEIIVEILIKGLGFLVYRRFNKDINPDGFRVFIVGLVMWGLVILGLYEVIVFLDMDSCLDSGGSWNYQFSKCEKSTS